MKIALLVPSWPPGDIPNGIVTYASQLVPALRRIGHEVFILTGRKTNDDDRYTVDIRDFASPRTFFDRVRSRLMPDTAGFNKGASAIASAINKLVEKHKLDVVEMEETWGLSYAISRLKLLPVVVRLHGPWFLTGRFDDPDDKNVLSDRRIKWEGRAIQRADFVTAPSIAALQAVRNHYNLSLTASRVIPNPLDAANEPEIWDAKTCDANRLLFIGRFDALKGGDLVLRAFAELAASYPRLRLTFVGPDCGIKTNGKTHLFKDFIINTLSEQHQPKVEFCGQISHSRVMRLRSKHFATIVASRLEMFPYSVLEAMSLGCPLVTTAVGGIPELIEDQRNGLLIPSQDVPAMTAACKKLLNDHALAARLGRQAWLDCHELYRPDSIAEQTIEAYERAINNFKFRNTDHLNPQPQSQAANLGHLR